MDRRQFDEQAEAVSDLLRARLGVRGRSLRIRLRRAGRRLPKPARAAGDRIVAAQAMAENPRLWPLVGLSGIQEAFTTLRASLERIDPKDRRRGALLGLTGAMVFNLMLAGALVIGLLVWRGLI